MLCCARYLILSLPASPSLLLRVCLQTREALVCAELRERKPRSDVQITPGRLLIELQGAATILSFFSRPLPVGSRDFSYRIPAAIKRVTREHRDNFTELRDSSKKKKKEAPLHVRRYLFGANGITDNGARAV